MLNLIFLILKIIGIILLVILGLILLIILTVLLVPIRYRVVAEHGEDVLHVDARASWLLHLLCAKVTHIGGILHIRVRILFFTIFDNLKPKKPKDKVDKPGNIRQKRKIERRKEKRVSARKNINHKARNSALNKQKDGIQKKNTIVETNTKKATKRKKDAQGSETKDFVSQEIRKTEEKLIIDENRIINEKRIIDEKRIIEEKQKIEDKPMSGQEICKNNDTTYGDTESVEDDSIEDKGQSFFEKIASKVKRLKIRIVTFFKEWKDKITGWIEAGTNLSQKISKISDFIKDELNKQGFHITFSSLKKILKHILPTKLKSRIVFGTGDPCTTGQALGVISVLYSFYGEKVQIIPDFENKVLEGKHYVRGRIRLVTILIIVIKLMLDKKFQQLRKNFQILKEAL